jgi:chloramphenicol 3-O phosphotransferase
MSGRIVILNGAPRSGKSSIAAALQNGSDAPWLNLGVDAFARMTPARWLPGIGLRPGGERPDLEPVISGLYAALYESIAAFARQGLNVVTDVGHHDSYSKPLGILNDCARRLAGLPVLFVGVRCSIDVILARRAASEDHYAKASASDPIPAPVQRWQDAVHAHGIYDLEVDTSKQSSQECADAIRAALAQPVKAPSAFQRLAQPLA